MNWFTGSIGDAISKSKSEKLIFLVHAFDPSSPDEMSEAWNDDEIKTICEQNCVSLRLESTSVTCTQFKQIYTVSNYPTTYLIGTSGIPLECLVGAVAKDVLLEKLKKSIEVFNNQKETDQAKPTTSSTASNETVNVGEEKKQKDLDEKVALAKEKLRQIQEKKRLEEEERERNREIERRKVGQEMIKSKKDREDQEAKRIADEKRKEKLEDDLARKKIREQIQKDREEKLMKYNKEKEEAAEKSQKAQELLKLEKQKMAETASKSDVARIQFRLIDGSSISKQFEPEQKLADAREFIAQKLKEMNGAQSFTMHSTFPKRDYTSDDMKLTLRELHLAPSACILIIPSKSAASKAFSSILPTSIGASSSGAGSSSSLVSYGSDLLSLIFLPVTIIWSLVSGLLGINTGGGNRAGYNEPARTTTDQPESSSSNLRRRNPGGRSNVGQLGDGFRDDDENATWNGNSTQQM